MKLRCPRVTDLVTISRWLFPMASQMRTTDMLRKILILTLIIWRWMGASAVMIALALVTLTLCLKRIQCGVQIGPSSESCPHPDAYPARPPNTRICWKKENGMKIAVWSSSLTLWRLRTMLDAEGLLSAVRSRSSQSLLRLKYTSSTMCQPGSRACSSVGSKLCARARQNWFVRSTKSWRRRASKDARAHKLPFAIAKLTRSLPSWMAFGVKIGPG
mmetsp:Transcript_155002/g.289175  ORF Transcript_155002/g.289175 Transcript_155002/m.289175 type:complete len:216 (-) Transcript_155002:9-656(-)